MSVSTFRILGVLVMILGWMPMVIGQAVGTSIKPHSLGLAGVLGMVAGFILIGISSTIGKPSTSSRIGKPSTD